MKPLLLILILAALLAAPTSSEAALFRRRAAAVAARPRIVARAQVRRFVLVRPHVRVARGAVRLRGR